jgi:RNase P/RNase MRP subunit POP5
LVTASLSPMEGLASSALVASAAIAAAVDARNSRRRKYVCFGVISDDRISVVLFRSTLVTVCHNLYGVRPRGR